MKINKKVIVRKQIEKINMEVVLFGFQKRKEVMYNPIFNNEKLKKSRKKRKLSIKEVAEKIDVPVTTLQKYESGSIKKIPLDKLKKICDLYEADYYMYSWWTRFNSLSEIILHFICFYDDFKEDKKLFEILDITEYFDFDTKDVPYISLYNKLTVEEKEDYQRFRIVAINTLKSDKYFSDYELEKENVYLFCYFFAHKIKREKKVDLSILKEEKINKK